MKPTKQSKKKFGNWKIAAIFIKFEQCGFTIHLWIQKMQTEWQTV